MIEIDRIRRFNLLSDLSEDILAKVAEEMSLEVWPASHILFRKGDQDRFVYFLLEGEIALHSGLKEPPLVIRSGTDAADHPVSRLKPRRYTATTLSKTTIASIDEGALEDLITVDQAAAYEVTEFEGEDPEWMFAILRAPTFAKVPAVQMAAMFSKLESVNVPAGMTIVREGEHGDYYYLIRNGRAQVSRLGASGNPVVLAELQAGDGFGEEALISGEPRNATVTMLEDSELMRLAQSDFNDILKRPLVQWITPAKAATLAKNDGVLVDIRLEDEFKHGSVKDSINIPLYLLRSRSNVLDRSRKYILFCQTERRSCVGAFLLSQRGFDAYALKGGMNALKEGSLQVTDPSVKAS
jgi:CRP-like cAMP-binding protein